MRRHDRATSNGQAMSHRLFIVAALCSGLVCVAGTAAWAVSASDSIWVFGPITHEYDAGMTIDRGTLVVLCEPDPHLFGNHRGWEWLHREAMGTRLIDLAPGGRLGFAIEWTPFERAVWLPLWLFAAAGLVGTLGFARLAGRKRRSGGCSNCGYDLRASEGRCPECGRPTVTNAGATT